MLAGVKHIQVLIVTGIKMAKDMSHIALNLTLNLKNE
jgi:hypothetical protein